MVNINPTQQGYSTRWNHTYWQSGILRLQYFIDTYILNNGTILDGSVFNQQFESENNQTGYIDFSYMLKPFPTKGYLDDPFPRIMKNTLPLFYLLLFLYPITHLTSEMVKEKEDKIREILKMNGVSDMVLWCAWYITYGVLFVFTCLAIIGMSFSSVFPYSNKFLIFLYFYLFSVSMITFAMLISVFFSKATSASVVTALLFFIAFIPNFLIQGNDQPPSRQTQLLVSLLSPTCFGIGSSLIMGFESSSQGILFSNLSENIDNFNMASVFLMLFLDGILYGVLAIYFNKVVKNEYGTNLPWYFLFQKQYWCPKVSKFDNNEYNQDQEQKKALISDSIHNDKVFSSLFEVRERNLNAQVKITGLTKEFIRDDGSTNIAVNNLSIDLEEGSLCALLGHNGAGKSTLISILTGILPATSGIASIYGYSLNEMETIRKNNIFGLCPQTNVIFPTLTNPRKFNIILQIKNK